MNKTVKFDRYIKKLEGIRDSSDDKDFWTGCISGVYRYVYGDQYITDEEHKKFLYDKSDLGRGYLYGVEGVYSIRPKVGRPRRQRQYGKITFTLAKDLLDRCPRPSLGVRKRDASFFRDAIKEKLERDGL